MFTLIKSSETRIPRGFGRGGGTDVGRTEILGMTCAVITVDASSPGRLKKSVERAKNALDSMRADEVCFELGFPLEREFADAGFSIAGDTALNEYAASRVCAAAAEGENVYIYGRPEYAEFSDVLSEFFKNFRRVSVSAAERNMRFVLAAADEAGASVVLNPAAGTVLRADCAVFFQKPQEKTELGERCRIFASDGSFLDSVSGGTAVFDFDFSVRGELPDGFNGREIVSRALKEGKLTADDICIGTVALKKSMV